MKNTLFIALILFIPAAASAFGNFGNFGNYDLGGQYNPIGVEVQDSQIQANRSQAQSLQTQYGATAYYECRDKMSACSTTADPALEASCLMSVSSCLRLFESPNTATSPTLPSCPLNSSSINGACTCNVGYQSTSYGYCTKTTVPAQACESGYKWLVSQCVKFSCTSGYVAVGDKCVPPSNTTTTNSSGKIDTEHINGVTQEERERRLQEMNAWLQSEQNVPVTQNDLPVSTYKVPAAEIAPNDTEDVASLETFQPLSTTTLANTICAAKHGQFSKATGEMNYLTGDPACACLDGYEHDSSIQCVKKKIGFWQRLFSYFGF
jgi:hypothetical protein